MTIQHVTLGEVAKVFRVHPRTILRALRQEHNTYWYEDSDSEEHPVKDIANAYGMRAQSLVAVMEKRDKLLLPDEAAKALGMAARTFRKHLHNGTAAKWGRVGYGGITRYLNSKITEAAIDKME